MSTTETRSRGVAALLLLTGLTLAAAAPAAEPAKTPADAPVSYYKQVRPIFQAQCQGCHQPAKDYLAAIP